MHFGRITDPSKLDLQLPDDAPATKDVLKAAGKGKPAVYVGCPVWADRGFVGKLYPKGTKSAEYVREYAKQFQAIELNALGYGLPPMSTIKGWVDAVTPEFKFCPKFPQHITHRRDFQEKNEETDRFLNLIVEMGDHVGMSLFQLPDHFKPNRLDELVGYMASLPADMDVAVEVRNEAWFKDKKVLEELCTGLAAAGKSLVITDTPGRRDVLHMRLTVPKAFIRFNGANLHPTDYTRTDEWVARTKTWLDNGLQELYFFPHEPDKYKAANLAAYFIKELNEQAGLSLPLPKFYNETNGLF